MTITHQPTPLPQTPPLPIPRVEEELLRELHAANVGFHQARTAREQVLDGSFFRYQERLDQATQQFREAERKLEEVTKRIESNLHLPPPPIGG